MFDVYGFASTVHLLYIRRTEYIHSCRRRTVGIVGVGKDDALVGLVEQKGEYIFIYLYIICTVTQLCIYWTQI
jgi:hypothetical protein